MLVSILAAAAIAPTAVVKVFVVSYFPVVGENIDAKITGNVGGPYTELKAKTEGLTAEACRLLEEGSKFRGYKNPDAVPALDYQVVGSIEFKEAVPTRTPPPGKKEAMPNYNAVMDRINVKKLVEEQGVQEIWMWGYHSPEVGLWESNMSSPYGDISNSDRDEKDLPVLKKTYTVYHYNYGRGVGEMLENHMHQLEHLLNFADGRESTPPEKWNELLFWGKFVGSDASHKIVTNPARCGWTHYAPNSEKDYDWANPRYVETDIEDWKPDGIGKTQRMNADRWDRDPIKWRVYWLQAIPGLDNGLTYQGAPLRNWWSFVADWDTARKEGWKLTMPKRTQVLDYRFANEDRLVEHWQKHGLNREEFNPPLTKESYLRKAQEFFSSNEREIQHKTEANGDHLRYKASTNEFGVLSSRGVIRTYFRPRDGIRYWNRQ